MAIGKFMPQVWTKVPKVLSSLKRMVAMRLMIGHLVESGEETHRGHTAGIEGDVIDDHPINHDEGHDGGEYDILKLGFRHKKSSCDETSVVRYHPGGVCVSNINL